MRKEYTIEWDNHRLEMGKKTLVMGIVNVTPDSFSDKGDHYAPENAIEHALRLVREGADIIDIGGESTRPFSDTVEEKEELSRVIPVIEGLKGRISVPISIDTSKAGVAERAIQAGASIINDISALFGDSKMKKVARTHDVPVILMHMRGTPKSMQMEPHYDDLIYELRAFFKEVVRHAELHGIRRSRLIIDPGIGFGKSFTHNLLLIQQLGQFEDFNLPILIGTSRKAFIRHIVKQEGKKEVSPKSPASETGTQATISASVLNGAHIIRVHDVQSTCTTLKMIDAIMNAVSYGPSAAKKQQDSLRTDTAENI